MKVQELTKTEFLKKVANYEASPNKWVYKGDKPCIVDFYATWCGPCKMMAPVVAQLAEEYEGTVKVGKLDIDQNVDIVAQYKIMSVPTFLVIKDGEVKAKLIGAVSKEELVEVIDQAK